MFYNDTVIDDIIIKHFNFRSYGNRVKQKTVNGEIVGSADLRHRLAAQSPGDSQF